MQNILKFFNNFRLKLGLWFWVIIVIVLLVVWRILASGSKSTKVEAVKVSQGDVIETVSTSGTVKADRFVQLTFPTGGKIVAVGVKAGQKVSKGQFIAQVDTISLNAAYQNSLNTYRSTQAAVDLEHDNDKNYGSAETFAQKSTRTVAEVANDNAYNNVLASRENLKNAIIFAPFSGIIDTVNPSSPGIQVLPGAANYTIVDPSSVYFDAEVEETDLPTMEVGQKVSIKLDAYPEINLQGDVSVIGIVAFTSSTGGNAYHIRILLPDNSAQKFKVGMQGDADIIFGNVPNVIKVSSSAIFSGGEKSYVWLVEQGKIKKIEVTLGATSTDETEIKSGLSEGQTVVDNPPSNLKEGQKVSF
jgi:RND family efflux transporter MFP subunit